MSKTKRKPEAAAEEQGSVRVKIAASRVLEYTAEDHLPEIPSQGVVEVQFGFNVQSTFGITQELDRVIIILSISGFIDNDPKQRACFLKTEHVFEVPDIVKFKKDNEIELPRGLTATLIGTALGMARGILFAKNFGMSYAGIIVPLIDMEQLIPKEPFRLTDEPTTLRAKAH